MPGNPVVERKTNDPESTKTTNEPKKDADLKQTYETSGKQNVLNKYRSYTYNFTLSALSTEQANDPKKYRDSELSLVILKSGGKGDARLKPAGNQQDLEQNYQKESTSQSATTESIALAKKNLDQFKQAGELVPGFNERSPGRFDMFIDHVEIETVMAFTAEGGTTQPLNIKFDVIEPYSINGFIEALHTAAVAAGYPSYATASFLLKMDFVGYPDDVNLPEPEIVKNSSRYFVFTFTGMTVEVTERGTKYACTAIPFADKAFGQAGILKKPIKMTGEDVGSILTSLMTGLTEQQKHSDDKSKQSTTTNTQYDKYFIKFKKLGPDKKWTDAPDGEIPKSKLIEIGKDNALYKMVDPGDTNKPNAYQADKASQPSPDKQAKSPESIKYNPKETVVQFPEGANIHEIISAVIRDSQYARNIIKNMGTKPGTPDDYGMVEYFSIRIEMENQKEVNPDTKKPYQNITYVVSPFKIHYTAIPNYESQKIDEKKLKKTTNREYDYIYTGKNVDVLQFRLNFNNLYFEAVPAAMGNKETPGTKTAAAPGNSPEIKSKSEAKKEGESTTPVPEPAKKTDYTATSVRPPSGYNAGQPLNDPYSVMARSMHEKIINSVSLLTGELEIIGDPFYLVTGGVGNYNPEVDDKGVTKDGEAAHNYGQVLITINFRNPIDIKPDGMMYFDANRVPFSGVYMVQTVRSTFKDGIFKQLLNVIRIPGQIIDQDLQPSDPRDAMILESNPLDLVVEDTTFAVPRGERLDASSVQEQFGRGIPIPGLPGSPVNAVSAIGGLGGNYKSLLSQSLGSFPSAGSLLAKSAQIGLPLPNDVATNIRLSSSGLADLSQYSLANAAKVVSTVKNLPGGLGLDNAKTLAGNLSLNTLDKALKTVNPGSGIGQGATSLLFSAADMALTGGTLSLLTNGPMGSIATSVMGKVVGLGAGQVSGIVGDASNKVGALLGSAADPSALAAKVGLDPSKLSGLGGKLQSKLLGSIGKFKKPKSLLPDNVNLTQAANNGLVLDYIPSDKLINIPATPPYATALPPYVDSAYLSEVVSKGGTKALANLYGVSSVEKISSSILPKELANTALGSISAGQFNPLSKLRSVGNLTDISSFAGKVLGANSQLSSLTGLPFIKDQNIVGSVAAKFGSSVLGQSPLAKLVNNIGNPNAPPYTGSNPVIRTTLGMPPLPGKGTG
jgi:hypothetical protein